MADRARAIALALLALLIVLATVAAWREVRSLVGSMLLTAALVIPLLLPLPGMLRRQRRVYGWAPLCVAAPFLFALTEVVANPALRAIAAAMLMAGLALVVALVTYLRLTRGRRGLARPATAPPPINPQPSSPVARAGRES